MKRTRRTRKTNSYFRFYLLVALFTFITTSTASYLYFKPKLAFKVPFIESIESQNLVAGSNIEEKTSLRLYKSQMENLSDYDELKRGTLLVTAENVIKRYVEPRKVKLLDLYMDKNGTIYADFGNELRKNFNGDAFEEYQIIADLYKRIKINVPDFKSLKILINGKEVESLGGHIDISKPIGEHITGVKKRKTDRYF